MYRNRGGVSREKKQNFAHNERSDFVRPESGRGQTIEREEDKEREKEKEGAREKRDRRDAKKRKMRRRTKREVSCSLTRPLRYDNISRAPGKHCQRSPEGMLPKLAAVSFVGDSSSVRKRRSRGGGRSREGCCISLFLSSFSLSCPDPSPISLFLSFSFVLSHVSCARTLST